MVPQPSQGLREAEAINTNLHYTINTWMTTVPGTRNERRLKASK